MSKPSVQFIPFLAGPGTEAAQSAVSRQELGIAQLVTVGSVGWELQNHTVCSCSAASWAGSEQPAGILDGAGLGWDAG